MSLLKLLDAEAINFASVDYHCGISVLSDVTITA